jgi:hypothetical protein
MLLRQPDGIFYRGGSGDISANVIEEFSFIGWYDPTGYRPYSQAVVGKVTVIKLLRYITGTFLSN